MGWTTTFDASHKVKQGGGHRTQFARHIGRDADEAAGFRFGHSNKGIDPVRTALNQTMVNDGHGGYRLPVVTVGADGKRREPSAELSDYLDARLATVTKKLRTDAVVARPFVFKADPKWYDEHNPKWRTEGLNDAALALHEEATRFIESWGGQHNVVGYADHVDEAGHPERQIIFTPVTDDGRLSQKDYFPGPSALKRMHRELREHLKATCEYDAEMTVAARSREHLSSAEFSDRADKLKADRSRLHTDREAVAEREEVVAEREQETDAHGRQIDRKEATLRKKWRDYNRARQDLDERERVVAKRAESVTRAEADIAQREAEVRGRAKALDDRELALGSRELSVNVARVENDERARGLDGRERAVAGTEQQLADMRVELDRRQREAEEERERAQREADAAAEARARYDAAAEAMKEVTPRDMNAYMHRYMARTKVGGELLLDVVKRGAVKEFNRAHPFEDFNGPKGQKTVGQSQDEMAALIGQAKSHRADRVRANSRSQGQSRGLSL